MKTIQIENVEIPSYTDFYRGLHGTYPNDILGGEYDREQKLLKIFLTDTSTISTKDIGNYLQTPKTKLTFERIDQLQEALKALNVKIVTDNRNRLEILVDPTQKADVTALIKTHRPDFVEKG